MKRFRRRLLIKFAKRTKTDFSKIRFQKQKKHAPYRIQNSVRGFCVALRENPSNSTAFPACAVQWARPLLYQTALIFCTIHCMHIFCIGQKIEPICQCRLVQLEKNLFHFTGCHGYGFTDCRTEHCTNRRFNRCVHTCRNTDYRF